MGLRQWRKPPLSRIRRSASTPGTYTVTLIVKNASGADAIRQTNYITVYASPTVSFGLEPPRLCRRPISSSSNFPSRARGPSPAMSGPSVTVPPAMGQHPIHLYTQPGYYNVGLTVTNSGGCPARLPITRTLRLVSGVQPNFTWNETGNTCTAPFTAQFPQPDRRSREP